MTLARTGQIQRYVEPDLISSSPVQDELLATFLTIGQDEETGELVPPTHPVSKGNAPWLDLSNAYNCTVNINVGDSTIQEEPEDKPHWLKGVDNTNLFMGVIGCCAAVFFGLASFFLVDSALHKDTPQVNVYPQAVK